MNVKIKCGSTFNGQQYQLEINFVKVSDGFDITFGDPSWGLVMKLRGLEVLKIKNIFRLWSDFKQYTTQLENVLLENHTFTFNGNVVIIIPDQVDYLVFADILDTFKLSEAPVQQQAPVQQAPVQHAPQVGGLEMPPLPYNAAAIGQPNPINIPNTVVRVDTQAAPAVNPGVATPPFIANA